MKHTGVVTTGLALVIVIASVLVLAGCSQTSQADERQAKCFANETLIGAEMKLFKADSGLDAPLADVVDKLHAVCPGGGTYSYDTTSGIVTCSVHGHP